MPPRTIAVLAYDGARLMDVTAPLEVFSTASGLGADYRPTLCSPDGRPVTTAAGTRLLVDTAATDIDTPHTLIVPGSPTLPRTPTPEGLTTAITTLADRATRVASVCTGAFALARTGLLDNRRATTHWRHTALLARVHPRVHVEPDALHIRDGHILTSAGVSAGIDLSLALVEDDHGPQPARDTARDLVVFLQRPGGQSQFSAPSRTPPTRDNRLRAVLDAIAADPAAHHSTPALAALANVSTRHLTRLFHEQLDTTPAAHLETVRLEAAKTLLETGESVTTAARRSGLGSDESLRRAFLRHLGVTPSAYRARFRTTTP
ncbi:GlxA family transcriptional regulator [Nocardiopsis sp. EMB25]|uniref:GlxA family transcriptional regulator n=1 Tax=Nocardiopsis sp. EMB25 TaxID=2835867 RepID=UPI00228483B9|nr:GlxA family transcriptional regulator [Nocardiopsis sp. EMB25]MCY9783808.1 GlxA family transcriptional regulator [Nocardiopsis sp. EMB25]